ncbi:MAG: hypothetical protein GY703_04565 [Gammaproteobacteria bacterium]|nr:hypothetical protein [Gammaproteobacteria bacterium]
MIQVIIVTALWMYEGTLITGGSGFSTLELRSFEKSQVFRQLRATEKMNHPILLVSHPSYHYRHPASRESSPSMDVVCIADSVA